MSNCRCQACSETIQSIKSAGHDTPKILQRSAHVPREVQQRAVMFQGQRLQPRVLRLQGCEENRHAVGEPIENNQVQPSVQAGGIVAPISNWTSRLQCAPVHQTYQECLVCRAALGEGSTHLAHRRIPQTSGHATTALRTWTDLPSFTSPIPRQNAASPTCGSCAPCGGRLAWLSCSANKSFGQGQASSNESGVRILRKRFSVATNHQPSTTYSCTDY